MPITAISLRQQATYTSMCLRNLAEALKILHPDAAGACAVLHEHASDLECAATLRRGRAMSEVCQRCNGTRKISVMHGMIFDTDSTAERADAWHQEPCPDCRTLGIEVTA